MSIVQFYQSQRFNDVIFVWDDARLEHSHDYIYWLFPNTIRDPSATHIPAISLVEILRFRIDNNLRFRVQLAIDRVLSYLGFIMIRENKTVRVRPPKHHAQLYFRPNHIRIQRILQFLVMIDMRSLACTIYNLILLLSDDDDKLLQLFIETDYLAKCKQIVH